MSIRLVIADDHPFFRSGLRNACAAQPDLQVVGEARDGQEAVDLTVRLRPDVVLMDIQMPVLNGVEATRVIAARCPGVRVIMLTAYQQDAYVWEAIRAGAQGYVLKGIDDVELANAVRQVNAGGGLIDAEVANRVIEEFRRLSEWEAQAHNSETRKPLPTLDPLSESEIQVLHLLAQGASNDTIARQLSLSEKTVANRVSVIYQKLQVNNRVQAAREAFRRGWASLDDEPK